MSKSQQKKQKMFIQRPVDSGIGIVRKDQNGQYRFFQISDQGLAA